ncbi:Common central domain of tyrosinase, partial [Trichostrongylus colubriformis]
EKEETTVWTGPESRFPPDSSTYYDCKTIECVCRFLGGKEVQNHYLLGANCLTPNGQLFGRGIRKEYRELTDDERNRFHSAMWSLKRSGIYDAFARIHARSIPDGGAHSGPAFLPWHREFLKRIELALRSYDASVSMPYWDSVLDQRLPNPVHSVLWSNELLGGAWPGEVNGGAFRGWLLVNRTRFVRRNVGQRSSPMNESEVSGAMNAADISDILSYTVAQEGCPVTRSWRAVEFIHGKPHNYVGGDMVLTASSANDPVFFLHHSFVDLIWETWRLRRQVS